ncbi:ribonuclease H-like domain-containing protein [Tanacetum coccineum]
MDTGASSHLNSNVNNLSTIFNSCLYPSVRVGDGKTIPVTNTGHSILPTLHRPLHLYNVLVTPNIIKNLIYVHQFTRDNNCTIEFDRFGFSMKDFLTRHILLRCDSSGDLYPVTQPSSLPSALMSLGSSTWHQRLGHLGNEVLRSLVSCNFISCNKDTSHDICYACQLGKHMKLPFSKSTSIVSSHFEIVHSDIWTSPIDGTRKTTQRLNLHVSHISPIPKSPSLALSDPHWRNAMYDEYNALVKNGTWVLVPRPPGANIQVGIDCNETFSPIVKPATIHTVLSLALTKHYHVHQLDVKNAFLNGDLSETVYMHQPPGFVDFRYPHHVCRLQRSLYGLKQAPRAWFHRFAAYATRVGFSPSRCDSSLFIYRYGTDTSYLLIYVDDIVLAASSTSLLQNIIFSLHKEFDMTDLGALNYFLGIFVTLDIESKLGPEGTPILDPTLYQSLVGDLQYLTFTRPDLSYAVQQICLYMHDPREPHLAALKRILRYVQGTLEFGLQLYASSESSLVAYSDADWAGCPATRRSTSRYCVFLGNNLLSWSSKRQHALSHSSAEAEYRGVANVVAETAWLRNLLRELHTPLLSATLVYCDNVSVVYLSANPVQHQRTKHIEIDIHFVRDMVSMGHVRVLYVPSRYQYADIFTKGSLPNLRTVHAHLEEVATTANSTLLPDQILVHFDWDNETEIEMVKKLLRRCQETCTLLTSAVLGGVNISGMLMVGIVTDGS